MAPGDDRLFGWLDTPSPLLTYLIWYAVIGTVVILAFSSARPRGNIALIALVAIVVIGPIAISYHEAHRLNLFWQGRYALPMATGIPILAAALIDGAEVLGTIRSRLTVLICIAVGVADFAAFYTTQRRYSTGLPGPVDSLKGAWGPPFGNGVMTLWSLVATVVLAYFVVATVRFTSDDDDANGSPAAMSTSRAAPPASDGSVTESTGHPRRRAPAD